MGAMNLTPAITSFRGDHRFLSNFWPVDVEFEGRTYPSVEHAYQAAKCLRNIDRTRIAGLATAGDAKAAGQAVEARGDWEEVRIEVMRQLLSTKFAHPDLASRLTATGDAELIEGNDWGDTFWGVCSGRGDNHLGRLLMEVRSHLRSSDGRP